MWYVYESTINASANLNPDAFPVPPFCDPTTAGRYYGTNNFRQPVQYLAARVDPAKSAEMPSHLRDDLEKAAAENRNCGDFLLTPYKL